MRKRNKITRFGWIITNPQPVGSQSDHRGIIGNTRHLTKIICILKDTKKYMTITEIESYTGSRPKILDCLNWLVNNKILLREQNSKYSTSKLYFINPEWEKLKYGN